MVSSTHLQIFRDALGPLGRVKDVSHGHMYGPADSNNEPLPCPDILTIETIKLVLTSLLPNPQDTTLPRAHLNTKTLLLHVNGWCLSSQIVVRSVAK